MDTVQREKEDSERETEIEGGERDTQRQRGPRKRKMQREREREKWRCLGRVVGMRNLFSNFHRSIQGFDTI